MMEDQARKKTWRYWRKALLSALLGGLCGYFAGKFLAQNHTENLFGAMSNSEYICFSLGLIYAISGLFVFLAIGFPRIGAQLLNVQDRQELEENRPMLFFSAWSILAMGIILILVPAAHTDGPLDNQTALVICGVLLLMMLYAHWRLNQVMDEMMKSVSMEAGYIAFIMILAFGGIWVAVAQLGYAIAPQTLDWLSMTTGFLWVASFISVAKRGMLCPR